MLQKAVHQMSLRMKEIIKNKGGKVIHFKKHCDCDDCRDA